MINRARYHYGIGRLGDKTTKYRYDNAHSTVYNDETGSRLGDNTMNTIKIRIKALKEISRRFAVVFMGIKVAVAFDRDSGAKVGYNTIMRSGEIGSGGSRANWHCSVKQNSEFEIEVDEEFFLKNKNRIKNWSIEQIKDFTRLPQ